MRWSRPKRATTALVIPLALFWAGVWLLLSGSRSIGGYTVAVLLGVAIASWTYVSSLPARPRPVAGGRLFSVAAAAVRLAGIFLHEMVTSNWQQLRLVLAPRMEIAPHWIRLETRVESRIGRALLAGLVSMTPGTLSCELSARTLLIHVLDARDPEEEEREIRDRLEEPILRLEAAILRTRASSGEGAS